MTLAPLAPMLRGMARKLKVFGGRIFLGHLCPRGGRAVIATTSQKKAAEIAGTSLGEIRNYWSTTGNPREVELAMANPEKLIVFPYEHRQPDHHFIFSNAQEAYYYRPGKSE